MIVHLSDAQRKAVLQLLAAHLRQRGPETSGGLKEQAALVSTLEEEAKATRRKESLPFIWLSWVGGLGGGTVAALLIVIGLKSTLGFWVWPIAVVLWLIAASVGAFWASDIGQDLKARLDPECLYDIATRAPEGWIYREFEEEVHNHDIMLQRVRDFKEFLSTGGKISGSRVFVDAASVVDPVGSLPKAFQALLEVVDAKTIPQLTSAETPEYFYRMGMLAWKGEELPVGRRLRLGSPESSSAGAVLADVMIRWVAERLRKGIADACFRECLRRGWFADSDEKLASIREFYLREVKTQEGHVRPSLSKRDPGISHGDWELAQCCVSLVEETLAAMPNEADVKYAVRFCDEAIRLDPGGPSGLRARCLKRVLAELKPRRWKLSLDKMIVCRECGAIETAEDPSRLPAQLCDKHAKETPQEG